MTAKEALDQAHRKGFTTAAITYVPTEMITFAGTVYEVPVHEIAERN